MTEGVIYNLSKSARPTCFYHICDTQDEVLIQKISVLAVRAELCRYCTLLHHVKAVHFVWLHPFRTFAKFYENFCPPGKHTYLCIQGARNSFPKKFALVLNRWSLFASIFNHETLKASVYNL